MTEDERSVRAAEYVLGLASPAERAQVERDLERDFELRRAVYFWQDRLFPLTRIPDPTEPSPAVWSRIEQSLRQTDAPAEPRAVAHRERRLAGVGGGVRRALAHADRRA